MSNATTLQTNNNKISTNNTDLASILNTINNLPEAGSGGSGGSSVETCTLTINNESFAMGPFFYSELIDGKIQVVENDFLMVEEPITNVVKNSILCFDGSFPINDEACAGGISILMKRENTGAGDTVYDGLYVLKITDDCELIV